MKNSLKLFALRAEYCHRRDNTQYIGYRANTTVTGSVSASGLWTLGTSGGTEIHVIKGKLFRMNFNFWILQLNNGYMYALCQI